jgi:hypothetical protein
VADYFPSAYEPHDRNASVHSWHLFQVALLSNHEEVRDEGGSLSFGLLNLADALGHAVEGFMAELNEDPDLQRNVSAGRLFLTRGSPESSRTTLGRRHSATTTS